MRLEGGDYLLLLSRTADLAGHSLAIVPKTQDALSAWNWTTRSSRIFSIDNAAPPDLSSGVVTHVYFVGPLDPGVIDITTPTFVTLGTYNVIFFATTSVQKEEVEKFLSRLPNLRWERWSINNSRIEEIKFGNLAEFEPSVLEHKPLSLPAALAAAAEENSTLFAASFAKATVYFPHNATELQLFAQSFRNMFKTEQDTHGNDKLSWLVNVNAHLSRYTSQTFSGVSPITATECHFWSHSLLGVGLASQALVRIRRFVEQAVGKVDWIDRLDALKQIPFDDFINDDKLKDRLFQRRPTALHDWIFVEELASSIAAKLEQAVGESDASDQDPRLPLITCFSGRDGFRSTPFSLTAPLEVISGCNTYGWTPMTLSHEICHVWMNGILGTLFPKLDDQANIDSLGALFDGNRAPRSVFEDVQVAFYFGFDLLFREMHDISPAEEIPIKKQRTWFEKLEIVNLSANEILTHVLDYQFFFQCDEDKYIRSIWSSWDVIPNIKDRLAEYLIRSACALLSERLNRADPIVSTLDRLQELLDTLAIEIKNGRYLQEATELLRTQRARFEARIRNRDLLVRLAKIFFADSSLAKRLQHELQETGGPYTSLRVKEFDADQILNPLRFVLHYSVDKEIDRAKSLWILHKLAFAREN